MKFIFVINQVGAVNAGLLGQVSVEDLCVLDYLGGWFFFPKTKRAVIDAREYCWISYENAVTELPLLFNPSAQLATLKNQLSRMVQTLRQAGLIETTRVGRELYFRLTPKAAELASQRTRGARIVTNSAPTVTPPHDDTVTGWREGVVTQKHDGEPPSNISETEIKEPKEDKPPPLSPSAEGEVASFVSLWNSTSKLPPIQAPSEGRARKFRRRLADTWWRDHWREGVERVAASDFLKGAGPHGWRATCDWFLAPDTLAKVLEGAYDNRPLPADSAPCTLADLRTIKAAIKEELQSYAGDDHAPLDELQKRWDLEAKLRAVNREIGSRAIAGPQAKSSGTKRGDLTRTREATPNATDLTEASRLSDLIEQIARERTVHR